VGMAFTPALTPLLPVSSGEPGAAGFDFLPAAAVLGLGLLGTVLGAVLALERGSDPRLPRLQIVGAHPQYFSQCGLWICPVSH
jgi:hypothetical protein